MLTVCPRLGGQLFTCTQDHTPFDVVAWHGKYVFTLSLTPLSCADELSPSYIPYKYDTDAFIAAGSLTKDHSDPSIFTVLTAKSKTPGVALADFAVFKERWDVAGGTFRPPVSPNHMFMHLSLIFIAHAVLPPQHRD